MSVKTVAVSAVLTVGLLVPASALAGTPATTAAKKQSIAAQIKTLKKQVAKNTKTGKSNTSKISKASKSVATTVAGINKNIDAANARTSAVDTRVTGLDGKINAIVPVVTDALTKLQAGLVQVGDGLTKLAASYQNFEYGVVQLYSGTTAMPGAFLATPRLDPTVEQSTVTGQFPCVAPTGGACTAGQNLHLQVAVRSANPTANDAASKVYCRVTASQADQASGIGSVTAFVTSTPNAAFGGAPAYQVTRSPIVPTSAAELAVFPLSMVSTDTQVDLTSATNSAGLSVAATTIPGQVAGGFRLQNTQGPGLINVTLSCLTVPNPAAA